MNKKIKFIILCLVFALLLIGAYVFYNKFSDEFSNGTEMQIVDDGKTDDIEQLTKEENDGEDAYEQESGEEKSEDETTGENLAPDVGFFDGDGNSVMLSEFFDKPTVLNFWATWCGPCKSEMPGFENLYNKYSDRVNFVMLNVSDTKETVADFLKENGYSFPIYFDQTQIASYTYGASSIPLTFVINKGGEVYGYQIGVLPEEALEGAIKTVLGEE